MKDPDKMSESELRAEVKAWRNTDPTDRLLYAVGHWLESVGGSAAVAGGISVQRWPEDRDMQFTVAVKCLGRVPTVKTDCDHLTNGKRYAVCKKCGYKSPAHLRGRPDQWAHLQDDAN
jgi:hypothetical protein